MQTISRRNQLSTYKLMRSFPARVENIVVVVNVPCMTLSFDQYTQSSVLHTDSIFTQWNDIENKNY